MFGLIYFQQDDTEDSVNNINGVLYLCLLNTTMQSLMTTCLVIS
jgi:hypothetical protein